MRTENNKNSQTWPFLTGVHRKVWIVVADAENAKILSKHGQEFDLLHEIPRPDRVTTGLNNNTIGRGGAPGAGHHKYEPSMQESRQEEMELARLIASWLDHQFSLRRFDQLVLVSSPEMLGEIRKSLTKSVKGSLIAESDKHLTGHADHALAEELLKIIPGPDRE